jgi:hypothetical protein
MIELLKPALPTLYLNYTPKQIFKTIKKNVNDFGANFVAFTSYFHDENI